MKMTNNKTTFAVNSRVWVTVAETSPLGGGRHRGVIENVVKDMFDDTILYLVKTCGTVVPAREEALEEIKTKRKVL